MIKKFINKLLGKSEDGSAVVKAKKTNYGKREDIGVATHGIDNSLVDDRARDVVHVLKNAGFEAYIVGGAVSLGLLVYLVISLIRAEDF